jgi:hypothetical protein
MFSKVTLVVLLWVAVLVAGGVISVVPVWLLWNVLMPDLFGTPKLTFWQAFGLVILTGLLFGDRLSLSMRSN